MVQWTAFDGIAFRTFEPDPQYLGPQNALIVLVRSSANEAGLELEDFITDEDLELHYAVLQQGRFVCDLSKGWNDSGFLLSDTVALARFNPNYKENLNRISRICSKYMLVQSTSTTSSDVLHNMILRTVIYSDGFNGKVLKEAVRNLREAYDELMPLIEDR